MNIDWSTAPEWANYRAMDACGAWWWYENEPTNGDDSWNTPTGEYQRVKKIEGWRDTLECKPKVNE